MEPIREQTRPGSNSSNKSKALFYNSNISKVGEKNLNILMNEKTKKYKAKPYFSSRNNSLENR